jgi:Uma2 family endonuclease
LCGVEVPDDTIEVPDPIVIVEILSPSTGFKDLNEKLRDYFTLASVQHYLIVDPEKRLIIHHARGDGDVLLTRLVSQGQIRLIPPGISFDIADIFPADAAA